MADRILHYHDFYSNKTIDFSCAEFVFGGGIGRKDLTDKVVSLVENRLTLESDGFKVKGAIILDIATGKLISVNYRENEIEKNPASRP